uniref:Uncharacterized protein n=1 Tax=Globisporangium ultimum (strain ATCC 200006 / CBS 805.95 / DAOM BR144) TaxID=431595 RepID=K3WDQ9_GLOUD
MKQRAVRFTSLDVFRGLTICLMIFVNYGGGGFHLFNHSVWDGVTIADLVLPWFAWIMGFGIFLSSHSLTQRHLTRARHSIMLRSTKLFALGLFVNNGADWSHWRIPGVLQALAVAFAIVSFLSCCFPPSPLGNACKHRVKFFTSHTLLGILPLIVLNLSATFLLHVPGCPVGYLGPGGTADDGKFRNCTGGAHLYVDTFLFGRNHLFQTPTCQKRYHTGPYDPEGALNWLMAATTAYLGYVVAAAICCMATKKRKLQVCLASGSALLVLSVLSGGVFISARPWIPFNKNMWSISYVLLSSGVACVAFAMMFALLDSSERCIEWDGWPFVSVGKNSVFIYVM